MVVHVDVDVAVVVVVVVVAAVVVVAIHVVAVVVVQDVVIVVIHVIVIVIAVEGHFQLAFCHLVFVISFTQEISVLKNVKMLARRYLLAAPVI